MKKLITAAFALTVLAVTLGATAANARPRHRICTWHHHHRVCRWR